MIFGLVGPTGVGKSDLALEIATLLEFEILSVDAYQIYKKMNIGTAKVNETALKKVPHHMINIVEPSEAYDVKTFQEQARTIIDEKTKIQQPLLCVGGSGFYLKSILHHFEFSETIPNEVPSLDKMIAFIKAHDESILLKVHPNNHKRIKNVYIRLKSGSDIPKSHQKPYYDYHLFGLTRSREALKKIVSKRVDQMMEQGLLEEVKNLYQEGLSKTAKEAIGYKEWEAYFNNEASLEETIQAIKSHTFKYIKKQETYFKHQFNVEWFNLDEQSKDEIKATILKKIKHLKSMESMSLL